LETVFKSRALYVEARIAYAQVRRLDQEPSILQSNMAALYEGIKEKGDVEL